MSNNNLHNWKITGFIATILIVLSIPLYLLKVAYLSQTEETAPVATFVGGEKCKKCHEQEYKKWRGSHHDLAMDIANETTVLGDFNNAVFTHNKITTRFFRKNGKFYVHTQGPVGEMEDFEVTHVFGVYPLQQYLIPFPGGRLQCLTIAWDSKDKKWFALPNHIDDPTDWLHWTNNAQNWNGMCAECHSTHLQKGYDHQTDTFNTTWSEIDVSCEACHGPGSLHVQWADRPAMALLPSENLDLVVKTDNINSRAFLELCARCHSRRSFLEDYVHADNDIMDHMLPALLNEGLYYADGQILDEVYVYGSFVQSKMYRNNIRCNDCHDVHSLKLVKEGNDLCLQCHRADTFDTKNHHFHKKIYKGKESEGDDCVRCHMPGRFYMGNDFRLDHSIRIPRPDLSLKYNTPNSCNASKCHDDKSIQWSVAHYTKWYGISRKPHYGTVLDEGRKRLPKAREGLVKLVEDLLLPPIVRATALTQAASYRGEEIRALIKKSLADDEALLRHTALRLLARFDPETQTKLAVPLLYDEVKGVRIEAAYVLTSLPRDLLNKDQQIRFEKILAEYRQVVEYSADFPQSRHNLGNMYANLGQTEKAEKHYKAAIQIDDQFYPAKNNLAILYNKAGRNQEAEELLREIYAANPDFYEIAYSLGLLLAEEKRFDEAVSYLQKAAKGMPGRARIHYNLGLLLQYQGRLDEAEKSLKKAVAVDPDSIDLQYALADHYIKRGKLHRAKQVAQQMIAKHPSNKLGHDLLQFINQGLK